MGVKGGPNTTWRRGPMYTLEASPSFCADKDKDKNEDVEKRERLRWVLEGNQCYKRWRSLLISFMLELLIVE